MNQHTAIRYFIESEDPSGLALKTICDKQYGEEWYDWDPVTVVMELKEDFHADASETAVNRLSAVQVLMTTGRFYQELDVFLSICNTLSSGSPSFEFFDPVTVPEAAWAVVEIGLMREPVPFSYSVRKYIKVILEQDGLLDDPPKVIRDIFLDEDEQLSTVEAKIIFADSLHDLNRDGVDAFVHDKAMDIVKEFMTLGMQADLQEIYKQQQLEQVQELAF